MYVAGWVLKDRNHLMMIFQCKIPHLDNRWQLYRWIRERAKEHLKFWLITWHISAFFLFLPKELKRLFWHFTTADISSLDCDSQQQWKRMFPEILPATSFQLPLPPAVAQALNCHEKNLETWQERLLRGNQRERCKGRKNRYCRW